MSGNRQWSYQQDLETFVEEFEGNREAEGYTNKRRTRKWRWRARRSDAQSLGNWSRALPRSTALYRSTAQTPICHLESHPQRLESAIFWSQQSGCRSPSTDILISYCASSIQRVYSCLQLMGDTMHVSGLRISVTVKGDKWHIIPALEAWLENEYERPWTFRTKRDQQ